MRLTGRLVSFFLMIYEDLLNINKIILTFDYMGVILAVQNVRRKMRNMHNPEDCK